MREGAWGVSSGLIYVPSSYADTAELTAVTRPVGRHRGLYVSHIRGEGVQLLQAVNEALEIGRNSGAAVHISHFKSTGQEAWGLVREAAKLVEQARAGGQTVTADQYPYIASSTSLRRIGCLPTTPTTRSTSMSRPVRCCASTAVTQVTAARLAARRRRTR